VSFSTELITVLDYLAQKLGIVIDWTAESVKPYIENLCARFIEYQIFNSFLTVGAWAVFMLFFMCWLIPTHLIAKNRFDWDWDRLTCVVAAVAWVGFVICLIGTVSSVIIEGFEIIECWKMPEKVIIEYVQGLLNSAK
jgi:hypothetical protein